MNGSSSPKPPPLQHRLTHLRRICAGHIPRESAVGKLTQGRAPGLTAETPVLLGEHRAVPHHPKSAEVSFTGRNRSRQPLPTPPPVSTWLPKCPILLSPGGFPQAARASTYTSPLRGRVTSIYGHEERDGLRLYEDMFLCPSPSTATVHLSHLPMRALG